MPDIFIAENKKNINHKKTHKSVEINAKEENSLNSKHFFGKISKGNILSSFISYPKDIRFETQEEKEEIIFILRKHFITNTPWILIAVLMLIIPSFFPYILSILPFKIPGNFQFFGIVIWYSLITSSILMNFLIWYYNVYIVTDERIVDVDFYNLTVKQIASAPMEHIQDVTIQSGGIIKTIFNFAVIRIQTAGTKDYICFEDVPHPETVARKILEIAELNRNEQT